MVRQGLHRRMHDHGNLLQLHFFARFEGTTVNVLSHIITIQHLQLPFI